MIMRKTPMALLIVTGAIIGTSWLAGCAVKDPVLVVPLEGVAFYPPTDPATVTILRAEPQRPFKTLAQVVIDQQTALTKADLERRLRVAVAKIGANAIILLPAGSKPAHPVGAVRPDGQYIYAFAIRYAN